MRIQLSEENILQVTDATLNYYDKTAEEYLERSARFEDSSSPKLFCSYFVNQEKKILELGCGKGEALEFFVRSGHRVVGVEGSAELFKVISKEVGQHVLFGNMLRLSFDEKSFDGVYASMSLFHLPKSALVSFVKLIERWLLPEGILMLSNPLGDDVEDWNGASWGSYLTQRTWKKLLTEAGFEIIHSELFEVGEPWQSQERYRLVGRKYAN